MQVFSRWAFEWSKKIDILGDIEDEEHGGRRKDQVSLKTRLKKIMMSTSRKCHWPYEYYLKRRAIWCKMKILIPQARNFCER